MPCMAGPSKIIYDKSSGQMYVYARLSMDYDLTISRHICGFKSASPFDEPQQWDDVNYFQYGLIQPSDSPFYWEGTPPGTADWIKDANGWTWWIWKKKTQRDTVWSIIWLSRKTQRDCCWCNEGCVCYTQVWAVYYDQRHMVFNARIGNRPLGFSNGSKIRLMIVSFIFMCGPKAISIQKAHANTCAKSSKNIKNELTSSESIHRNHPQRL